MVRDRRARPRRLDRRRDRPHLLFGTPAVSSSRSSAPCCCSTCTAGSPRAAASPTRLVSNDRGSAPARERPLGRERPAAVTPRVRVDVQVRLVELVDVQSPRLAAPVRARLSEPRRDRDGDAAARRPSRSRTRAARRRCSGGCGRRRSARRPRRRGDASTWLRRATGFLRERHGAPIRWWCSTATRSCARRRCAGPPPRVRAARRAMPPRLVPPRPHRVEPDGEDVLAAEDRLGRLPLPLELLERPREPRRERVRDVVVAREPRAAAVRARAAARRRLVLLGRAAMREVAARDHELRLEPLDSGASAHSASAAFAPTWRSDTCRMRVSTGEAGYTLETMTDESTEIFDDLYLGLRAGGAVRKQRRGEPLTIEEQEALGRWQRLSTWRKVGRDRRFRGRNVRSRRRARRPRVRPLAQGLDRSSATR